MSFNLSLDQHPSQARHPNNPNEPFFDNDGKPIPLLPDHGSIRLDGLIIAYVVPGPKVSFIRPMSNITQPVADAAVELVNEQWEAFTGKESGRVEAVHSVPESSESEAKNDDE